MIRHALGSPITPSTTDDHPSPTDASHGNSRKRKAPSSNSRGVASLTPEQLAKKRQNDREAQRAIRERTKAQIESLERRIQELTTTEPYQELQEVIREKDAVLAENQEIKRRLASILQIIQPLVGAQGLTALATAAHGNVNFSGDNDAQRDQFMTSEHDQSHHVATEASTQPFAQQWQGPDVPANGNKAWQSSLDALNHQRDHVQRGLELSESGERLSFNFLLDANKHPPSTVPQSSPFQYPPPTSPPSWEALPKNLPPTCPLDGILLKFLHSRRQESASRGSRSSISGPAYPSVSSLLNPSSGAPVDDLSQVMTDIISKFPGITGLPQQVGILIIMFWYMRWCLHATPEHYQRIPEWLRPTSLQVFEAHAAWIDYVPWPKVRDKLVSSKPGSYPFENWFIPFTTGISVNWPYDDTDCLLCTGSRDEPIVNPVFERHVMRLENWSLGPEFLEAFPSLADCVRIQEK